MKLAKRLGGLVEVLDKLPVGAVIQSPKGELLYANDVARAHFNANTPGVFKKKFRSMYDSSFVFLDENGNKMPTRLMPGELARRTKKTQKKLVNYKNSKTEESLWLQIESFPMLDKKGSLIAIINILNDYSEIKRSFDSLKIINRIVGVVVSVTSFYKRLKELTRLMVPIFADWCFMDIIKYDMIAETVESHIKTSNYKAEKVYKEIFREACLPYIEKAAKTGKEQFIERLSLGGYSKIRSKYKNANGSRKSISVVVTPMKVRNKVLGAVTYIRYRNARNYSRADVAFLSSLGAEISILVDNARLYDKTRKSLFKERSLTKKLNENRRTLNLALEAGRMAVWDWDIKRDVFVWHSEEGGEVGGDVYRGPIKGFLKLIFIEDRTGCSKALRMSVQKSKDLTVSFRILHQGNNFKWFRMDGALLLDRKTKPERLVGVLTDITKEKNIYDRLRQSEKKFRMTVSSTMDSIILYDNRTGEILDVNKSSCTLFGKLRESLVTMNIRHIFDIPPLKERGEIATKNKRKNLEYTQTFNFLNNMNLLFIRDITDRRIEEKRREHFLGVVSHELKNALTLINANVEILRRALIKAKCKNVQKNLEMINTSSRVLNTLINDLLDVTRIRQHKFLFSYEFFDFDKLVKEVIRTKRDVSRRKILYHSAGYTEVLADKNRIMQVMVNLIDNAIKYSPKAKKIEVINKKYDRYVSLTIRDYGIGISNKDMTAIFELYHRGKMPGKFEGLGVGLYISNEIIKRHGGRFFLKSKKDEGSEFTFRLPYRPKIRKLSKKGQDGVSLL